MCVGRWYEVADAAVRSVFTHGSVQLGGPGLDLSL